MLWFGPAGQPMSCCSIFDSTEKSSVVDHIRQQELGRDHQCAPDVGQIVVVSSSSGLI